VQLGQGVTEGKFTIACPGQWQAVVSKSICLCSDRFDEQFDADGVPASAGLGALLLGR
jgi:hypothetical protein